MKTKLYIVISLLMLTFISINAQRKMEGLKRQAISHMQNGRFGDAIDLLNKFISADPRYPEGYYLRGLSYENRKQYSYAVFDYRKAIKLDQNYGVAKKALARTKKVWYEILYNKIEGHKREIAIDPKIAFNYLEIGKSYRWLEEWEKAEEWYDKYLALDENASPDEIIRYTLILTELKHIKKGELILKKWVAKYPEDWRLWSRYGYFTLWLGKYKIAENSFENALKFKPFFKEAEDGLDLARREGYVTQFQGGDDNRNDVIPVPQEYAIDKYYRIVKNNPNDDETRFLLVDELIDKNRFEEAYQQLLLLKFKFEETERYATAWEKVQTYRKQYYEGKITELMFVLQDDPYNSEASVQIADYYISLGAYTEAQEFLRAYLNHKSKDAEAHFLYAKALSLDRKFDEAIDQSRLAVDLAPNNNKYKLLNSQLNVWNNGDLDLAEQSLQDIINTEPNNINALITLGTLNFQRDKFDVAEVYEQKAENIEPSNVDVLELKSMLEAERIRQKEAMLLEQLNTGRDLAGENRCEEAIPYYLEFIENYPDYTEIKNELASVYICADKFDLAIKTMDNLMREDYSLDVDKMRAKVIYWSGDSLQAFKEFTRLVVEDPDDLEMQLYFGDVNLKMGNYDVARKVYNALKDISPDSYAIEQRLAWLPPDYKSQNIFQKIFSGVTNTLFSYTILSPMASYFTDNLGYSQNYYGASLETGFTRFVSIGATWYRGEISNDFGTLPFTTLTGNISLHLNEKLTIGGSYGNVRSPGVIEQPVIEAYANFTPKENVETRLQFTRTDGAFLLYSPDLVFTRIPSNSARFIGSYLFKSGLKISADYNYLWTDATSTQVENLGNIFTARIGKTFYTDLMMGYEYYFGDFKYNSTLYFTPQNYVTHSIWGEWKAYNEESWDILIGGKLGYVPASDFILREISAKIGYQIMPTLRLYATAFAGSSIQNVVAYSSTSFYVNLFWTIY